MSRVVHGVLFAVMFLLMTEHQTVGLAHASTGPAATIRPLIRANAERDLPTLFRLMAHDAEITSYTKGQWVLLSSHESFRNMPLAAPVAQRYATSSLQHLVSNAQLSSPTDLSGEWEILEVEDDKRYKATLDKAGNGPYTQHEGRFITTKYTDRLWQGTWLQTGNDREGGFEVLLSEDGRQAKGMWWYSRVGTQKNIPPREHGGTYVWKRLTPPPSTR